MERPVAVVTGASSGLGRIFAQRLSRDHDLLLVARRRDRLEGLAAELRPLGAAVEVAVADLASDEGMGAVSRRIREEPRLGLLVNNAGFGTRGMFWEAPIEEQECMHRLHVVATVRLTHAALANLVPRDRGAVINVASVASYVRRAGSTSYSATKTWVSVFTEGLYLELKARGSSVVVQALCPGFTATEFHDRMGVDRARHAASSLWLDAGRVVDDSLKGLARGRLFVIPDWRYRLFAALFPKLPSGLRIALEQRAKSRERC